MKGRRQKNEGRNTPHLNPLPQGRGKRSQPTARRRRGGYMAPKTEDDGGHRPPLQRAKTPPICFCETNPPISGGQSEVIDLR